MLNILFDSSQGGGLGNLLFYTHVGHALAKEHNAKLFINADYTYEKYTNIKNYQHIFNHLTFVDRTHPVWNDGPVYVYTEPNFFYKKIQIPPGVKTVILRGYFQSYKYSSDVWPEIVDVISKNMGNLMKEEYSALSHGEETTCVHVRRCDYLQYSRIHTNLTESYYEKAIALLPPKKLLVYSDDINEVKNWKVWQGKDITFVDEPDAVRAMWLMSMSSQFIIANSSLSLNAYMIAMVRGAQYVAPANWFGPDGLQFKIEDLVPPHRGYLIHDHSGTEHQ